MAMTAGNRAQERMAFRLDRCKATVCGVGRGRRDCGNENLNAEEAHSTVAVEGLYGARARVEQQTCVLAFSRLLTYSPRAARARLRSMIAGSVEI